MDHRLIGVFGGTFDPVHFGHLRTALEMGEGLALDEVRMIPCAVPPHRAEPGAGTPQRLAMLNLAVEGVPGLRVDTRELEREGPSYMVDTLASLRHDYPQAALCLLLGADAFLGLSRWHRWERLLELAHIAVAHRPGWTLQEAENGAEQRLLRARLGTAQDLRGARSGRIVPVAVTQLDISATAIRQAVHAGRSIRFLLPEAVRRYIADEGLYR